jgi:hypothetical protein
MKRLAEFLSPWAPSVFATYICLSTLSHIAPADAKYWEPAFYSFLPMSFVFVSIVIFLLQREVRELRSTVTALQAKAGSVAV